MTVVIAYASGAFTQLPAQRPSTSGLRHALRTLAPGGVCTAVEYYLASGTRVPLTHMYATDATLRLGVSHARAILPELLDFVHRTGFPAERVTTLPPSVTNCAPLIDTLVRTAASPEVLHDAADGVRRLAGQLTGRRRAGGEIPATDEFPGGVRMYSPATGAGSPLAPPMRVTPVKGGMSGTCVPCIAHEGPPGYGHGGMSALLLDELMGRACTAAGMPAMTVSLQMRYRRPVPLDVPLRLLAHVTGTEDRTVSAAGSITTEDKPRHTPGHGTGVFVSPDPDPARFPGLREQR